MRFHRPLDDILGNSLRVRVLRALTHSPSQRFTGRELARECGASPSQTIAALRALEDSGLVAREVVGPSHAWRLSSDHILVAQLSRFFDQESGVIETLKAEVRSAVRGLRIERAWLFGSVARQEERPMSDIDLLVQVGSVAEKVRVEDALGALSPRFARRFGNPLSSIVLTRGQLLRPDNSRLLMNVQNEGIPVLP
jgi:predicted nucleotidyltransferase